MGEKIDNIFGEPQFLVGKVGDNEFTQPIIFGKCDKPKIEGDKSGIPFKKTWSGELSVTFTVPAKVRQVKGNRRQRKAAAFANKKTCFGLFGECSARSKKADKKRKKLREKQNRHRNFIRFGFIPHKEPNRFAKLFTDVFGQGTEACDGLLLAIEQK